MTSQRVRPGALLLDTGPLLTYLALRYADSTKASKAYADTLFRDIRKQSDRFGATTQERFRELIETRQTLTTPHVILEATRLREHSELVGAEGFSDFSLGILTGGDITEIWWALEEVCEQSEYIDLVHRFGVADASLLFVSAREGCLLLTDDDRLFDAYGAGSKFQIRLLDEYLASTD